MQRRCFLCDGKVERIFHQKWKLPNIQLHDIVFSICRNCGLVLQTETLDENEMNSYYASTATYINPGRGWHPSKEKINAVFRQLQCVKEVFQKFPKKVFQVGCSDGYTLSQFKINGSNILIGIDPSYASHKIAKKLYNIDTIVGVFQKYHTEEKYNLIILTHIVEHLYNPVSALLKCNNMQNDGDFILIEVPLLEREDRFPPGMLSLEHVNYFSEKTLVKLIYKCNYTPYSIKKSYYVDKYPVITIMAKKEKIIYDNILLDYLNTKRLMLSYLNREKETWHYIEKKILKDIFIGSEIYIWGAGVHTTQLLANTSIERKYKILGILDSSPTKWGIKLGDLDCYNPNEIKLDKDNIILISSYASESEIYNNLQKYILDGVKVYKIYGKEEN